MIGLKKRLFQIVVTSAVVIASVVGGAAVLFSVFQNKWDYDQTVAQMEAHLDHQQKDLAVSYLIPEQQSGRKLLLEEYLRSEKLASASVVEPNESVPAEFSNCTRSTKPTHCKSGDGKLVGVLAPISESTSSFGHLLKVRNSKSDSSWIFQFVSTLFVTITLVVITVLFLLSSVYSKVVSSLNALEEWTRNVVLGKDTDLTPQIDFQEIKVLGENIKRLIDEGNKLKEHAVAAGIARQVAHDIRAPVTALSIMVECMKDSEMSAENRLAITNSTQRINEIADSLIRNTLKVSTTDLLSKTDPASLSTAVQLIVQEKQNQHRLDHNIEITCSMPKENIFVNVDIAELKRVLSNLMNNGIESLATKGKISLALIRDGLNVIIQIADNGCGIPEQVLAKLGEEGFTYNRANGNGLGVFHAIHTIKKFGGEIQFISKEAFGTTVQISLPVSQDQKPVSLKSVYEKTDQVVLVDDDPLIHRAMEMKFESESPEIDVLHFHSYHELKRWYSKASRMSGRLFLVDYDLALNSPNGLDLIEELGIMAESILVTSRFDDPEVIQRARLLGVKVLAKHVAASIPLNRFKTQTESGAENELS